MAEKKGSVKLAPLGLRMEPNLKQKVKEAAARDGRSINAQIVQHLRAIYLRDGDETVRAK
jgi:hypothetical protein